MNLILIGKASCIPRPRWEGNIKIDTREIESEHEKWTELFHSG